MSATTKLPPNTLATTPYDRAAGLLVALLLLAGAVVFCLALIWFGHRLLVRQRAVPVRYEELTGGGDGGALAEGFELAQPTADEAPVVAGTDASDFRDLLDHLAPPAEAVEPALHQGAAEGTAAGTSSVAGPGADRGRGPGEGAGGLPREQRWEILFDDDATLTRYAEQLDFFGIELGVVGIGEQVVYVSDFSNPRPTTRSGPRGDESRLYMSWRDGGRAEADRRLLSRAGLSPEGKIVVQFIPTKVEQALAEVEQNHAGLRPEQIRRTRFGIRRAATGLEFFVLEQQPW